MSERADRTNPAGRPQAANQRRAEPDPDDVVPQAPATLLAAAPPAAGHDEQSTARTAHAVPGRPDGEVDTSR